MPPGPSPDQPAASSSDDRQPPPAATPLPARAAALRILDDIDRQDRTGLQVIDEMAQAGLLADAQRSLATELVMGVMRHRLTLACILDRFAAKGWKRIDRPLREVLALAAYQLIWLDGIPAFAAVNEAVEQAKAAGGPRAGRFVNAVLRELLRGIEHRRIGRADADATRAVPIDLSECCQFRQPILPDPSEQPVDHLALATSHPVWLVSRWTRRIGIQAAQQVCRSGLVRPPVCLRPNGLRTDAQGLLTRLQKEDFADASLSADGQAVYVSQGAGLMRSAAFSDGWFQPQDRTAMEVVHQMHLGPGQRVLDLCAGLGTKSTQMAEIMQDRGTVLACDRDPAKLTQLQANCRRLGLSIVRAASPGEMEAAPGVPGKVDWILVDAPCSNTGVLARRPEARYRLTRRALDLMVRRQKELLVLAARLAGEHTRLAYSTCSIDPAENEEVAADFAHTHPAWRLAAAQRMLPGFPTDPPTGNAAVTWRDGGYWAIWSRP